jgi:biopolymer transport protein ExbB
VVLLLALPAWGQQATPPGTPAATEQPKSFFDVYIAGGGLIGGFIILLSVAMVALIIEHFVTIQRDKLVPPQIVVELEQLLEEEQYEEAMNICEASRNYLTNVVGAALQRAGEGFESMYSSMEGRKT